MPKKRSSYNIGQTEVFKVSRSAIEEFIKCPRCCILNRREGIAPPAGPGFTLNSAVDALFKNEFDHYRETQTQHPIQIEYGLDLVPFKHPDMDTWRDAFKGIQYLDSANNFLVYGGVDDIWVNPAGVLTVIDYKTTSKAGKLTELGDASWYESYRRQLSIYVWLLRKNGFEVSDTAYWVYANGQKDRPAFNNVLEFETTLIDYVTDTAFVEPTLAQLKLALDTQGLPQADADCGTCAFFEERRALAN